LIQPGQRDRIQIVEEICSSPEFSGTAWACSLLRYLAQHPGVEGQAERSSAALLTNVFSKISKEPPYDVDAVRGRVARLREFLDRFYTTEPGRHMPWRVSLPKQKPGRDPSAAHWDLRFERNSTAVGLASTPLLHANTEMRDFWEGFLDRNVPTRLVYGEPMFYRNTNRSRFTRDIRLNFPKQLQQGQHAEYAFVTLGDLRFLLDVVVFLSANSVSVRAQGCLHESHIDFLDSNVHTTDRENLIVVGTPRSNGVLSVYQQGDFPLPFTITEHAAISRGRELRDGPHPKKRGIVVAYAVLTRRPSLRSPGSVLLVASNHGRTIQKIGEILTSPELFAEFLAKPGLASLRGHLPPYFQVLVRCEISDHGRFVNSYDVLDVWVA
jgi:hypothetical protein